MCLEFFFFFLSLSLCLCLSFPAIVWTSARGSSSFCFFFFPAACSKPRSRCAGVCVCVFVCKERTEEGDGGGALSPANELLMRKQLSLLLCRFGSWWRWRRKVERKEHLCFSIAHCPKYEASGAAQAGESQREATMVVVVVVAAVEKNRKATRGLICASGRNGDAAGYYWIMLHRSLVEFKTRNCMECRD